MQRFFLPILLAVVAVLAIAAIILSYQRLTAPVAPVVNTAVSPVDPLKQEMACIDGVLNSVALSANQAQAALEECRR